MPTAFVNGANLSYEVLGEGAPIVLTTGGNLSGESLRPLATRLAERHRVLIYDRRNTGASDIIIDGDGSEHDVCCEDLHALLNHLGMSPAYVGGVSWGCGLSLLLAIRHPEDVRALLLWAVGGGGSAAVSQRLGDANYGQYIEPAQRGCMAAVIETPYFAERIAQNPSNRERLLAMDPRVFAATMARWRSLFIQGRPNFVTSGGATEAQFRSITVPAIVVPGTDEVHTPAQAERLHSLLPQSTFVPSPIAEAEAVRLRESGTYQSELYPRLASIFSGFLAALERRALPV